MSPSTPPLPPATGTMHYLFLSTTCLGFHGSNFFLHLHTLSLSSGRRCLTLAPLRIRIQNPSSFGRVYNDCDAHIIARHNVSFPTIPFRSLLNNIPLNNDPSLAANAADCPKAVENANDDSDCSVETAVETTKNKAIELLSSDNDNDDAVIDVPAHTTNTNATDKTTANIINAVDTSPPTAPDQTSVSSAPAALSAAPGTDDATPVAPATSKR
eukprot:CAMPEP_0168217306 /NCGR_PEP_ID=MMETSP0140_2-20121125/7174_1 /TAXON_ID=44445 /ORGANISM="Pseudo-nitzschia australis, Strain 10249 10 AB" /LENGTH=212 /DNA_ID=CAMNT_0008145047 /DNA_START=47 /DNA_END=685 /DNA_ORIENTATION=-